MQYTHPLSQLAIRANGRFGLTVTNALISERPANDTTKLVNMGYLCSPSLHRASMTELRTFETLVALAQRLLLWQLSGPLTSDRK
jgi:hypothetical protein